VKQIFDYSKTRYQGLAKNENRLALLPGFTNLLRPQPCRVWIGVSAEAESDKNPTIQQGWEMVVAPLLGNIAA